MKHHRIEPLSSEIESLLANERAIAPVDDDVRARILDRARSALRTSARTDRTAPILSLEGWLRRPRLVAAVSLGLFLFALGAAAFYLARTGTAPTAQSSSMGSDRRMSVAIVERAASAAAPAGESAATVEHGAPGERIARDEPAPPAADHAAPFAARDRAQSPAVRSPMHAGPTGAELRLLQSAREAVARGDFAAALVAVGEHARRFPSGELSEEREALRVKALAGLGRRDEARLAADAFRKHFPKSILLPPLEEMLEPAP